MEPRIETIAEKKLVGKRIRMTLSDNKTFELWSGFMPWRKEIRNSITPDLFSMQIYDKTFDFRNFNTDAEFEKWAAMEVTDFDTVPEGMESFTLPAGIYAVFIHRGAASRGPETFRYIFGSWLPDSEFVLDDRPHFERLGEKYKHEDSSSEEEIWIPVRPKE